MPPRCLSIFQQFDRGILDLTGVLVVQGQHFETNVTHTRLRQGLVKAVKHYNVDIANSWMDAFENSPEFLFEAEKYTKFIKGRPGGRKTGVLKGRACVAGIAPTPTPKQLALAEIVKASPCAGVWSDVQKKWIVCPHGPLDLQPQVSTRGDRCAC
jgi:hypothetical protein